MFSVKLKVKEGRNSLPRSSGKHQRVRRTSQGSTSGRSSILSNRSNGERKEKRVRIITHREKDRDFSDLGKSVKTENFEGNVNLKIFYRPYIIKF